MKGKKEKIQYHEHDTPKEEEFPDISNVASANECTGLMYKTPVNSAEVSSYEQLFSMAIPKGKQEEENLTQKLHREHTKGDNE